MTGWWLAGGGILLGLLLLAFLILAIAYGAGLYQKQARERFQHQREQLQQEFFQQAASTGKPKGLRWKECQWEEWVEFVRHRKSGELAALVSLTIHFEAIEGGDMEGVEAVGLPRNASAVFFFNRGKWHTTGKAIFNKNPDEALVHFQGQYEPLK
jgi:hypothetical protein